MSDITDRPEFWVSTRAPMPIPELKDEERTPCEVWSRVMGYHRPISQWNAGKQSEHRDRKLFREQGPLFAEQEQK